MRKILLLFFILLGGLIALLPQIATHSFGKKQITRQIEAQLGGHVEMKTIRLSWRGDQICEKLVWSHPSKGFTVSADRVTLHSDLLSCIRSHETSLDLFVEGAHLKSDAKLTLIKKQRSKELEVAFSPIAAQVEKRVITFKRTDLTINDSLQAHTLGTIDLKKNCLDLTLGVPSKTLKKAFGIKEIPEGITLEFPLKTKLSSHSIEKELLSFVLKNALTLPPKGPFEKP